MVDLALSEISISGIINPILSRYTETLIRYLHQKAEPSFVQKHYIFNCEIVKIVDWLFNQQGYQLFLMTQSSIHYTQSFCALNIFHKKKSKCT